MERNYVEFLFKISAIVTSFTIVGKFLIGVWKKAITDPQNRAMITMMNPVTEKLEQVLDFMADSKTDRLYLHERNNCQDAILNDHEKRVTVLESWKKDHQEGSRGER